MRFTMFAATRCRAHTVPSPKAAGASLQSGAAIPGRQHCHLPEGSPAHTSHSSDWADSPEVYFADMVLLYHRHCHMIAESRTSGPATAPGRDGWKLRLHDVWQETRLQVFQPPKRQTNGRATIPDCRHGLP